MQKLIDGLVKFRKGDFEAHRDLFKGLKAQQNPHTPFITCSDSRVDPNMITGTLPGELFIIRNIIETGEVFIYDSAKREFLLANG